MLVLTSVRMEFTRKRIVNQWSYFLKVASKAATAVKSFVRQVPLHTLAKIQTKNLMAADAATAAAIVYNQLNQ